MRALVLLTAVLATLASRSAQGQEPTAEQAQQKVAVFELRTTNTDEARRVSLMAVLTSAIAAAPWLSVISRDEIATMLDAEAQKQLVGCDDTSCLAEIAGALDVDLVVSGAITPLGAGSAVSLQLINQRFANVMNRVSLTWPGAEERLPEVLEAAAQLLILEPDARPAIQVQVLEAPDATEVFIDEQSRGQVDASGTLTADAVPVGVHSLRLIAPGHQMRELAFVARAGKDVRVNGTLDPLPFWSRWWFWTGAGLLGAAALGTAAVVTVAVLADNTGSVRVSADPYTAEEAP